MTLRDLSALAGLLMLFAGVWLLSLPAALIVTGVLLLTASVWGHLNEAPQSHPWEAEDDAEAGAESDGGRAP